MGWIFQGNPKDFDIDDYLSRYPELIYWRTPRYAKEIAIGDRAFIWRAGNKGGAIAIGSVVELPKLAEHVNHPGALGDDLWITDKPDPKELKTGIHIEELRISSDDMIPRSIVKADPLLAGTTIIRMANATVFKLLQNETEAMERLWGVAMSRSVSASSAEGDCKLRSHLVRERSPRLRADKIAAFRAVHGHLQCEICGHSESCLYPDGFSDKIFEVHHRSPLATAATPVRTTLDDLAVLCANCHRSVHATKSVDENFKFLIEHFKK